MKMVVDGKPNDCGKAVFCAAAGDACCAGKLATAGCCGGKPGCDGGKAGCAAQNTGDKGNKAGCKTRTAINKGNPKSAGKSCCGSKPAPTASPGESKACDAKRVVTGKSCEYFVGDQTTACWQTARIRWMQARIVAATRAVAELTGQEVAGL